MTGSGAATVSYAVTGLTPGTTYTFKIRAVNAAGDRSRVRGGHGHPHGGQAVRAHRSQRRGGAEAGDAELD